MPFPTDPDEYIFKMPFASSIHPQYMEPSETLSMLYDINASMASSRRLPLEILDYIKNEVHRPNTVWENIRSAWTAFLVGDDDSDVTDDDTDGSDPKVCDVNYEDMDEPPWPLSNVVLDPNTMKYHTVENLPPDLDYTHPQYRAQPKQIGYHMSPADLLYRLRCLFPEMYIDSCAGDAGVWSAMIHHKGTEFSLSFSDFKGIATLYPGSRPRRKRNSKKQLAKRYKNMKVFSEDSVKLLNALFGTVDIGGETQLAYFHPAAVATRPSSEPRYPAVPIGMFRRRIEENQQDKMPYRSWVREWVPFIDLSPLSFFRSLLPDLKYDVNSRKIDPVNGTIPLTEVISSALLYYRLLCKYPLSGPDENAAIQDDDPIDSMITSVWQMKFAYHSCNRSMDDDLVDPPECYILFMDDHGLFDIQAEGNAVGVMDHIVTMINDLCSDNCTHPYNGLVAGCVAREDEFT